MLPVFLRVHLVLWAGTVALVTVAVVWSAAAPGVSSSTAAEAFVPSDCPVATDSEDISRIAINATTNFYFVAPGSLVEAAENPRTLGGSDGAWRLMDSGQLVSSWRCGEPIPSAECCTTPPPTGCPPLRCAACPSEWLERESVKAIAGGVAADAAADSVECADRCSSEAACAAFAFDLTHGGCTLLSDDAKPISAAATVPASNFVCQKPLKASGGTDKSGHHSVLTLLFFIAMFAITGVFLHLGIGQPLNAYKKVPVDVHQKGVRVACSISGGAFVSGVLLLLGIGLGPSAMKLEGADSPSLPIACSGLLLALAVLIHYTACKIGLYGECSFMSDSQVETDAYLDRTMDDCSDGEQFAQLNTVSSISQGQTRLLDDDGLRGSSGVPAPTQPELRAPERRLRRAQTRFADGEKPGSSQTETDDQGRPRATTVPPRRARSSTTASDAPAAAAPGQESTAGTSPLAVSGLEAEPPEMLLSPLSAPAVSPVSSAGGSRRRAATRSVPKQTAHRPRAATAAAPPAQPGGGSDGEAESREGTGP